MKLWFSFLCFNCIYLFSIGQEVLFDRFNGNQEIIDKAADEGLTQRKASSVNFKPITVREYDYNDPNFYPILYNHYKYDNNGNVTEKLQLKHMDSTNYIKETYVYDAQNNLTEYLFYEWRFTGWVLLEGDRIDWIYTSDGKKLQYLVKDFQNGVWNENNRGFYNYNSKGLLENSWDETYFNNEWLKGFRLNYTYDASDRVETEIFQQYNYSQQKWDNIQKLTYIYSNLDIEWDELIFSNWNGFDWYTSGKRSDIQWYDFEKKQANYYLINGFTSNTYYLIGRYTASFQPNGSYNELKEIYDFGAFKNDEKVTVIYDQNEFLTDNKVERWQNSAWKIQSWGKADNTYDLNNNLQEQVLKHYEYSLQGFRPTVKYEYLDFFYLGINSKNYLKTNIYPVPVREHLFISIEGDPEGKVMIFDVNGKLIQETIIIEKEIKVSVSSLPKGQYIIQVVSNSKTGTKKFIKL